MTRHRLANRRRWRSTKPGSVSRAETLCDCALRTPRLACHHNHLPFEGALSRRIVVRQLYAFMVVDVGRTEGHVKVVSVASLFSRQGLQTLSPGGRSVGFRRTAAGFPGRAVEVSTLSLGQSFWRTEQL